MAKKKKDLRVEIVKKLEGIKKFNLYWMDEVNKSIQVEAKDEEEARKIFFEGNIDFDKAEEGDVNLNEYSLEIEEAEE